MAINTNDILMLSVPAHHSPPNVSLCVFVRFCARAFVCDLSLLHPSPGQIPSDLDDHSS